MDSMAEQVGEGKRRRGAASALPAEASVAGEALPVVIAAWIEVDPGVAARLVEEWLGTADAEGNLTPACPVACELARRVAEALPEPEGFLGRVLPGLARCVERECERYDAKGMGLPVWPSAEEALFPGEHAPGRFTVDLAVLLSNEADAFCRLAEGREGFERALDQMEGEQRELDEWLKRNFWDEEASAFLRHDEGGGTAVDLSPCGLFPLAWGGRTVEMVEGIRPRAAEMRVGGWTARGWTLFHALLRGTPHRGVRARMRGEGLPPGATSAEAAAWGVLSAEGLVEAPGWGARAVRWLEARRRGWAWAGAACGGLALLVLLGWGIFHREERGGMDVMEMERQARLACEEGRHDRAAALYGQAARRGSEAYFRYRQAGEWMHLERFADAERAYRALLERDPSPPNARLNLALSVWRQGRLEEARGLYRAFEEAPDAEAHPELAARARLAGELIGGQLALDRP